MALLAGNRGHGYEIRQALEAQFGDVLPALNTGQVYSTLARLEREGLVAGEAVQGDSEFFMKFAIATLVGLVDPVVLIDRQRREYLQSLRDLDAAASTGDKGVAAQLMVEGAVLHLKADIEWLDLIESRLTQWERSA
jgi:hypothetical protein